MEGVGPEVLNLGAGHLRADGGLPVHPAGRLADLGQGVRLGDRIDAAYRAEVLGRHGLGTEKVRKGDGYDEGWNTHGLPGSGKSSAEQYRYLLFSGEVTS